MNIHGKLCISLLMRSEREHTLIETLMLLLVKWNSGILTYSWPANTVKLVIFGNNFNYLK